MYVLWFTITIWTNSEFQNKIFNILFSFNYIVNNIYTLTFGVWMVADGCRWVRMRAYGCVGAQATWQNMKTRQKETKTVAHGVVLALWPGKFPRTSCFAKKSKSGTDGSTWGNICAHACIGTYLHWGTGKSGETRQKCNIRACFVGWSRTTKTICSCEVCSGGEKDFLVGRKEEARDGQSMMDTNDEREGKKTNNGAKKKQNNEFKWMQNSCKNAQNTNVWNGRKKKQIINNCAQFKCSSVKGNIKKARHAKKRKSKRQKTRKTKKCHGQEPANIKKVINLSNLPKKTNKQDTKGLQKIRQASDYIYNVKKQKSKHSNKQTIPQDGYVNMVQNAKLKQVKKSQQSFCKKTCKKRKEQHRTKAQIKILVHSKLAFKTETLSTTWTKQKQQNMPQQSTGQSANTILEHNRKFPFVFKKKTGTNQNAALWSSYRFQWYSLCRRRREFMLRLPAQYWIWHKSAN